MMAAPNLAAVLADAPRNCWIALNEDETAIVSTANTLVNAVSEARAKGVDDPVVIWSPEIWSYAIY
jgi:predicted nuclease with RNAse H fold